MSDNKGMKNAQRSYTVTTLYEAKAGRAPVPSRVWAHVGLGRPAWGDARTYDVLATSAAEAKRIARARRLADERAPAKTEE